MAEFISFKLPDRFEIFVPGDIRIRGSEIGRLSIAGAVDLYTRDLEDQLVWPVPLVLVDNAGSEPDRSTELGLNTFYFSPKIVYSRPGYSLRNEWSSTVITPHDNAPPYVYLGHGGEPSEAPVVIFESPIPYDQEVFEVTVRSSTFPQLSR